MGPELPTKVSSKHESVMVTGACDDGTFCFSNRKALHHELAGSEMTRRTILKTAAAASAVGAVPGLQSAVLGLQAPTSLNWKRSSRLHPLTDCASIVMASVLGFDKIRHQDRAFQGSLLGGRARQTGQWRPAWPMCCTA